MSESLQHNLNCRLETLVMAALVSLVLSTDSYSGSIWQQMKVKPFENETSVDSTLSQSTRMIARDLTSQSTSTEMTTGEGRVDSNAATSGFEFDEKEINNTQLMTTPDLLLRLLEE